MAESSPKHGLTRTLRGWVKRVNKRPKWICSIRVAPTGEQADAYYEQHFTDLWTEPPRPAVVDPGSVALVDLCNAFLTVKLERRRTGLMDARSYDRYEKFLGEFCAAVGKTREAKDIGPADFAKFAKTIAHLGPHRRKDYILVVRGLFKWAAKPPARLPLPEYGDAFALPSKVEFRREKKRRREEHGLLLFTPEEIRQQLDGTTIVRGGTSKPLPIRPSAALRAMILLGINCAFGNTDIARLPLSMLDEIRTGWLNYGRHKTGADRRVWLWPETVAAIERYLKVRPKPAKSEYAKLMFLTSGGKPYVRYALTADGDFRDKRDKIAERYGIYLRRLGQARHGRGYYSLRRTARTIAAETGQELAIDLILGHADDSGDMARVYTQVVLDEKIKLVCEHIRCRVLGV